MRTVYTSDGSKRCHSGHRGTHVLAISPFFPFVSFAVATRLMLRSNYRGDLCMDMRACLPSLPALRRARGDLACPCPPGWEEKYAFITCGWRNRHICTIQSVLFKTQRALTATQRVYPRETLSDGEIDGKTKKCFSFFFLFGVVFPHAHSLCVPCLPGDLAARQSLCHPG